MKLITNSSSLSIYLQLKFYFFVFIFGLTLRSILTTCTSASDVWLFFLFSSLFFEFVVFKEFSEWSTVWYFEFLYYSDLRFIFLSLSIDTLLSCNDCLELDEFMHELVDNYYLILCFKFRFLKSEFLILFSIESDDSVNWLRNVISAIASWFFETFCSSIDYNFNFYFWYWCWDNVVYTSDIWFSYLIYKLFWRFSNSINYNLNSFFKLVMHYS